MNKLIFLLLLSFKFSSVFGQSNPQKEKIVLEIIQYVGFEKIENDIIELIIKDVKEAYTNEFSQDFYLDLTKELIKYGKDSLYKKVIFTMSNQFSINKLRQIQQKLIKNSGGDRINEFKLQTGNITSQIFVEWFWGLKSLVSLKFEKTNLNKFQNNSEDCTMFHLGKFKYYLPDSSVAFIERSVNQQKETYNQNVSIYNITWLSNCTYSLEIENSNNKQMLEKSKSKILKATIYKVEENVSFIIFRVNDETQEYTSKLIKID